MTLATLATDLTSSPELLATINVGHDVKLSKAADDVLVDTFVGCYESKYTAAKYRRDLESFVTFVRQLPDVDSVRGVSALYLHGFAESVTGAPRSRRERLATVRSFYAWCVKAGALRFNPAATLRLPAAATALHERILSPDKVARIIDATTSARDRALVTFMFRSGARVSEVVGLKWSDIVVNGDGSAVITIVRAKQDNDAKVTAVTPQLHAADMVSALLALRPEGATDDGLVFRSARAPHGPLVASDAWRIVKAAAVAAGLDKVSPHWLRHACATAIISRTKDLASSSLYMGHKSMQTTMKYHHLVGPIDMSSAFMTT